MQRKIIVLLFLLFTASMAYASEKPAVFVSIPPQKFFLEKLVGDTIDIHIMVRPGSNPATYEPRPSQMKELGQADAYFAIGVPFEKAWLEKIVNVNKNLVLVKTDSGIEKRKMIGHHHHDEGESCEHHHDHHGGLDPHIWLSPALVKIQVKNTKDALATLYPEQAETFERNYQSFLSEINMLQAEIADVFADKNSTSFLVFHPAWGYFADEFGLEQMAVEIEGKEPKPAQLASLIKHCKAEKINVIFAQPQFSTKSANTIAREIAGKVVLIDPLAIDWLNNLHQVSLQLKESVQQ